MKVQSSLPQSPPHSLNINHSYSHKFCTVTLPTTQVLWAHPVGRALWPMEIPHPVMTLNSNYFQPFLFQERRQGSDTEAVPPVNKKVKRDRQHLLTTSSTYGFVTVGSIYLFMTKIAVMVSDLWMEGVVQCKAKPIRISEDYKAESVVSCCKIKCLLEHFALPAEGLVLAAGVKKYSGECLAKAQEAISAPISKEMCDQISLSSSAFYLRDKIQKCLKNKSLKQHFSIFPLPVLIRFLGFSLP